MNVLRWSRVPLICLAIAPTAFGACKIGQIAEIPVSIIGNRAWLDGKINGHPIRIFVDTGAAWTHLSEDAATRLGLPLQTGTRQRFYGVGGEARTLGTFVKQLQIGSFTGSDLHLAVIGTLPGAQRRDPARTGDLVLGEDFLSKFTTEFDLAHGAIRLLQPEGCQADELTYWSNTYALAELEWINPEHPKLRVEVLVNGKRVAAILDTGATTSIIDRHTAQNLGVTPGQGGTVAAAPVTGAAGTPIESWIGIFETFAIGDEAMRNVKLRMADLFTADTKLETGSRIAQPLADLPSMLVGCDFFLSHRILVLPKEHKLLFTYNGGPAFPFVKIGEASKNDSERTDGKQVPTPSAPTP